jgi:hypothetical protein
MNPAVEEFAQVLVETVRDAAIQSNDRALLPSARYTLAKRWSKAASEETPFDFARVVIPDVVDDTIFYLLHAIDEGRLRLAFKASNGTVVDLSSEGLGELAGWYAGSDGWREMYSNERFVDDFTQWQGEDGRDTES